MSAAGGQAALRGAGPAVAGRRRIPAGLQTFALLLAAGAAALVVGRLIGPLDRYPEAAILPFQDWINALFQWLGYDLDFGLFTFRELTRGFAGLLAWPLSGIESLLFSGGDPLGLLPVPWIAVVGLAALIGHYAGGWRTALLAGGCFLYLSVFGVWAPAMETFSLVAFTVPLVVLTGLLLGILAAPRPAVERVLTPLFDIMQSIPAFAYLVPVVVLFGFGQVPGLIATAIFATPPMARCATLGLQTVSSEVVEAGRMAGCSRRQMLWKVLLPSARPTIMVGVNQAVMQTLAMVVIASLIGASGLGHELLTSLERLKLGQALEQGIAITVMAVALDRVSRALVYKGPSRPHPGCPFWRRRPHLLGAGAILVAGALLAAWQPGLQLLPAGATITTAPLWDGAVDWITASLYETIRAFRWFALRDVMIPVRDALLYLPWVACPAVFATLGYLLGGWRLALLAGALIAFPAVTGFWEPAVYTFYMISIAVVICIAIGTPLGLVAAHNDRAERALIGLCDLMQTFPSFIYLIPVVMLFKVGDLAAIIAVIAFATVPMIRYTNLGLRNIHPNVIEAARACGCRPGQLLFRVKLPAALPELMLGINQVIFMALFMVAITALIGTQDLGQEINRARSDADTGRALVAGLSIAFMGIVADRLIKAWVARRRARGAGVDE